MTGKLLQLSGIVVDLVHRVERLPSAGEEVETAEVLITAGGGFNAIVAARNFGVDVRYAGTIGTGPFAERVHAALKEIKVPSVIARRPVHDQGTCSVLVDSSGERSFISHHGAERQLQADDYARLAPGDADWLLLTGYGLLKDESAKVLGPWVDKLEAGPTLLFDPGPVVADIAQDRLQAIMGRAEWISANRAEATVLTGQRDPRLAVRALLQGRSGALVRCGAEGCWLAMPHADEAFIAGFRVDAVDTNGAGDCHDGAFIAASILGHQPYQAVLLANAAAALSTTRHGPATAPLLSDVEIFMESRGLSFTGEPVKLKMTNRRN